MDKYYIWCKIKGFVINEAFCTSNWGISQCPSDYHQPDYHQPKMAMDGRGMIFQLLFIKILGTFPWICWFVCVDLASGHFMNIHICSSSRVFSG